MPKEDIRVLHFTEDDLEGVEGWDGLLERMESCEVRLLPFEDEAPMPRKVIFNGPATIVLWDSGEKTVVKCSENDEFNYEKGLALAFMKYYCGNTGRYNDILRKHIPKSPRDNSSVAAARFAKFVEVFNNARQG